MDLGLKGKVALVTGGGRDVGRAISLTLAREGAVVAVNYLHSTGEAEGTVAEIKESGGNAMGYRTDVADYDAVRRMVEQVTRDWGRVDILVNNAGHVSRRFFLETAPQEWRRQIDVGLYGVMHCCHVVAPGMVERKSGRIINIAGDSARVGQARLAITAAARGGVLTLTRTLARELGRSSVTVNAVTFGWVETSHMDEAWWNANRDKILESYPIRRLGRPDDIAPLVTFLASDQASWITGQTISVSGGYTTVG
ncbi:MAG: 3-oxoacyl-ACP reductase FabG [Candidatus Rokubacteria bacterium]|nr:3-oxoacyl-ACP reductase FabG [Candidatus Rokubacteria bacterium]